jgi:hypothetical protein
MEIKNKASSRRRLSELTVPKGRFSDSRLSRKTRNEGRSQLLCYHHDAVPRVFRAFVTFMVDFFI